MKRANVRGGQGGRGRPGAVRRGPWNPGGEFTPPPAPRLGPRGPAGLGGAHQGRAGAGAGSRPTPRRGGQALGAGGSLTDLAVRVGDVATAVKTQIMAILQRSAAEPVGPKGCSSGAV